jgi:peptide/nickel transport system permease protein
MIRFLLRRLSLGVVVMFMVTIAIYGMFYLGAPMDIARRLAGRNATPATVEQIYKNLGSQPPLVDAISPLPLAAVARRPRD